MALKGTTRIELTNVKTGEVEVIEKENLVTNAVALALENPFAIQLKSSYSTTWFAGNILPLCPNLFGGILLYEKSIPESVDQLYAQPGNPLIGYSSNNVNNKTDVMRGSMNLNESGYLDTNDGYRFVFDFTTAQANGTIGAVGLTSKWGGIAGYGSMEFKNTQSPVVYCSKISSDDPVLVYTYASMIHYDQDTGIATAIYVASQNFITVTRIRLHTKHWKLASSLGLMPSAQVIDTQSIATDVFAGTTVTGKSLYYNFCDSGDGYVWGFEHAGNTAGNSEGNASINWIKIKLEDLSFQEGTWDIGAQLYSMGRHVNNPGTAVTYRYNDQSNCVILDGYLYCFDYALTGVYKIKMSNITDMKFIEHPDKTINIYSTSSSSSYYYYYFTGNMMVMGNRVCMMNGWLNDDTIVANLYSMGYGKEDSDLQDGWLDTDSIYYYPRCLCAGMYGVKLGVFSLHYQASHYNSTAYDATVWASLTLDAPYLATINNLASPVEKTADKTMKITYILREENIE